MISNSNNNNNNSNGTTNDRETHNQNVDELVNQLETYFKKFKISYHALDESASCTVRGESLNRLFAGVDNTNTAATTATTATTASIICIENVHIDKELTTVKDLLSLCDEFKVAENVRYNIDMVSLHKICPYLRELDNMIGMQTIKTSVIDQIIYFIQRLHIPSPHPNATTEPPIPIRALKTTNPFQTGFQTGFLDSSALQLFPQPSLQQFPTNKLFGEVPTSGQINSLSSLSSIFSNLQPHSPATATTSKSGKSTAHALTSAHNSSSSGDFMHTVLYGPPGTGKTEVAKILGNIFSHLGILKSNTFKKVTRSDLIAGYLGQTAIKTRDVINSAIGGVLFIDEAYALGNTEKRDSFSKECIDTLCEALSDHKHELMVIIAGYEKELTDCFFSYNEGLNSRFTWRYKIDNYTAVDLRRIFEKIVHDNRWTWSPIATDAIKDAWFKTHYDYFKYFGRDIEVFFTKTKIAHSRRVFCRPNAEKRILVMNDLERGFELFSQNEDVKARGNGFNGGIASTLYL